MNLFRQTFNGMIKICTIILIFLTMIFSYSCNSCEKKQERDLYDTVIIGAGLAGLAAAYDLKDYKTLIIEKEKRLGGRVLTGKHDDIYYELGASSAYPKNLVPFEFESSFMIKEDLPMGLLYQGNIHYCDRVMDCIKEVNLEPDELDSIIKFNKDKSIKLGGEAYKLLNSFFKTLHPGELYEYVAERQDDALKSYRFSYYIRGNGELINQYKNHINSEIKLGSEAVSVEDKGDHVKVIYMNNGEKKEVLSKTAIVATPATVAKKIITEINKDTYKFIDSIRYGSITAAALGFKNADYKKFSYVVTPEHMTNSIHNYHTKDGESNVLLVFYMDEESKQLADMDDKEVFEETMKVIRTLGNFQEDMILFKSIKRWEIGGTIISPESYENFTKDYYKASKRIILAGDYLNTEDYWSYGMHAAMFTGREAAGIVKELLKKDLKPGL